MKNTSISVFVVCSSSFVCVCVWHVKGSVDPAGFLRLRILDFWYPKEKHLVVVLPYQDSPQHTYSITFQVAMHCCFGGFPLLLLKTHTLYRSTIWLIWESYSLPILHFPNVKLASVGTTIWLLSHILHYPSCSLGCKVQAGLPPFCPVLGKTLSPTPS